MTRLGLTLLMVTTLLSAPAAAQAQSNPVMEHYRAYRAALEQSDFPGAERAAEAALAASEARDGDGGRTAVLALNLATARFQNNRGADAVAPARRAFALAEARGDNSGVDIGLARLTLNRALLAAGEDAAAEGLMTSIDDLRDQPEFAGDIYASAADLGAWALRHERYDLGERAWATAAAFAGGDESDLARARARLGEGASIFLGLLNRRYMTSLPTEDAIRIHAALVESRELLRPISSDDGSHAALSSAQMNFAEAIGWRAALRLKLSSRQRALPDFDDEVQGDGNAELPSTTQLEETRCLVNLRPTRRIEYPSSALNQGRIGVVVVHARVAESGEVVAANPVVTIGADDFGRAVERIGNAWRVERREDSPADCRMAMSVFVPVSFNIGW